MTRLKIIVPVYNSAKAISECIDSIQNQTVRHFDCYIVDDSSTDDTFEMAQEKIKGDRRFVVSRNKQRFGPLFSRITVADNFKNNDSAIIVTIDGDDELSDALVFSDILECYRAGSLVVYGQQIIVKDNQKGKLYGQEYDNETKIWGNFRKVDWKCGQPRTFRASLLKYVDYNIYFKKLHYWIPAATDQAMMFPLMEIAKTKVKCIERVCYLYNRCINGGHMLPSEQDFYRGIILSQPKNVIIRHL